MALKKYKIPRLPLQENLETTAVLQSIIKAERALGELKGIIRIIPNSYILLQSLGLQEAKSSSEIENIVTTNDEIFRAQANQESKNRHTKEVQNYVEAMLKGFEIIQAEQHLSENHICEIQAILEGNNAGFRTQKGTHLKNNKGEIVYTPPQNSHEIRDLMANLTQYINSENGLNPLVKMAVIHHQFESIHPFYDGNGRTGRIINILFLVLQDLLEIPALYLSRYIVETKAQYYDLLQKTREGDWEPWLLYLLKGIAQTALSTTEKIKMIAGLMQTYKHTIRKQHPKLYSQDLINNLFAYPYTKIDLLAEQLGCTRQTATKYLTQLTNSNLLRKEKYKNSNYFINDKLVAYLTH